MDPLFGQLLLEWKKPYLRDQDLIAVFPEEARRYDSVKYAIKKGILIPVRRGLYLIGPPYGKGKCHPFEIAQCIYGPSYISLESALSYHGWIPEAVYATTSVCVKRSKTVPTSLGNFHYLHTPVAQFFLNVERVTNENTFLMAEPWKAVADMVYCHKKSWKSLSDLSADLRIDRETMSQADVTSLAHIADHYDSPRVQKILARFYQELK